MNHWSNHLWSLTTWPIQKINVTYRGHNCQSLSWKKIHYILSNFCVKTVPCVSFLFLGIKRGGQHFEAWSWISPEGSQVQRMIFLEIYEFLWMDFLTSILSYNTTRESRFGDMQKSRQKKWNCRLLVLVTSQPNVTM